MRLQILNQTKKVWKPCENFRKTGSEISSLVVLHSRNFDNERNLIRKGNSHRKIISKRQGWVCLSQNCSRNHHLSIKSILAICSCAVINEAKWSEMKLRPQQKCFVFCSQENHLKKTFRWEILDFAAWCSS